MHDEVCMEAFFAEFSGFGNCGEQAAVAYKYLSRLPIAGLVLINLMGGNHEFVVLGAADPAVVLVKCITRFTHQYRSTKVAAWKPPQ